MEDILPGVIRRVLFLHDPHDGDPPVHPGPASPQRMNGRCPVSGGMLSGVLFCFSSLHKNQNLSHIVKRAAFLAELSGLLFACVLGVHHELTALPWRLFAKELSPLDHPNFLWPLDTRSQGVDPGVEKRPEGDALRAFGPVNEFRFSTLRPLDLNLEFSLDNPVDGQSLEVLVNGRIVASLPGLPTGASGTPRQPRRVTFRSLAGANSVVFVYGRGSGLGGSSASNGPQPPAMRFTMLRILPVVDQGAGS